MSAPFVTLDSLSYSTPDGRRLLDDLTLAFGPERTGLVGRNGAGKTTLIRLILGELTPAAGAVAVQGRIGVLRQMTEPPPGARAADLMGLGEALSRLARLEAGAGDEVDLAEADWTLPSRLDAALVRVGLAGLDPLRPAASLSGGEATRAALAGLLAQAPDLLILDEPTNNLDAEARALVADVLAQWRGGAIVVSHDRELLRQTDRIVELSSLGARVYGGNYDLYAERKAQEEAAAEQALDSAARDLARAGREAQAERERKARRDAGGRRFAARGSEPKILLGARAEQAENSGGRQNLLAERRREALTARLAEAQGAVEQVRRLGFDLPSSGLAAGRRVLTLERIAYSLPDGRRLFDDLSLDITGPERVAIAGPNGSGKTTLLKLAAGELAPQAGAARLWVSAAVFDQQTALLRPDETLRAAFLRLNPDADANAAHAALARFLFRNTAAERRVDSLSGGERLRAALACVLMAQTPPQLLILDEPSNHLDLDSLAAVEVALRDYDGALLIVSHDRDFLAGLGVEREIRLKSG